MYQEATLRLDLSSAALCLELDCNAVFADTGSGECPNCSSRASRRLAVWLDRGPRVAIGLARSQPVPLHVAS
jgi:hypothetical protein